MKPDAEIQPSTRQALEIQIKRGRREYMSNGGQDHDAEIYRDS